nr:MAG TPA: hypothetical protein [Caudoviricetes sp.]
MNTKVDINIEVDIEDVYSLLDWKDRDTFLRNHLDELGGVQDIIDLCFTQNDSEEFVNNNIYYVSDDILQEEIKRRGLNYSSETEDND